MVAQEFAAREEGQSWRIRMGYQHRRQGAWRWKTDVELFPDFEKYPEMKTRFRWLLSRKLNESISAVMGYVWSQEWGGSDPQTQHVIKANFSWTLNKLKKRKKKRVRIPDSRLIQSADVNSIIDSNVSLCSLDAVYISVWIG